MRRNEIPGKAVIPEGVYELQFLEARYLREMQMAFFDFKVLGGTFNGIRVSDIAMLRDKDDLWKVGKILDGLEVPKDMEIGDPLAWDVEFCDFLTQLKGTRVKVDVTCKPDRNGVLRNNITKYHVTDMGKSKACTQGESKVEEIPSWAEEVVQEVGNSEDEGNGGTNIVRGKDAG